MDQGVRVMKTGLSFSHKSCSQQSLCASMTPYSCVWHRTHSYTRLCDILQNSELSASAMPPVYTRQLHNNLCESIWSKLNTLMKNKGYVMQLRCTLWILHIGTGCFLTSSWCNWKWRVKVKRKSVLEEMQQEHVQVQFGLLTKEGGTTWSGSCVTHSGWKKDLRQTLWEKLCTISVLLLLFITCTHIRGLCGK